MAADPLPDLLSVFTGRTCVVERLEHGWSFFFGDNVTLGVGCPWRIVTTKGIAFADTDDRQVFGLPQPVDGQAESNNLLKGRRVKRFQVDLQTADIHIEFEDDVRVELFNNSSGYECWSLQIGADGKAASIFGLGGGDVAIYSA